VNTINRVRIEMGLSRPKMLELIGAKVGKLSLLTLQDIEIEDQSYIERARVLRAQYDDWVGSLYTRLDEYDRQGYNTLTSSEVQDLFNLRDLHIAQLRFRGTIQADRQGYEYSYSTKMLRELISRNSKVLTNSGRVRGPLAFGFLRWLGRKRAVNIDLSKTGRFRDREPVAV
jgi:hypothetical protein